VSKKSKLIIIAAIIAGMGIKVLDAKVGESQCGEGKYNQTTGECKEER
jgi:hypothetical protein